MYFKRTKARILISWWVTVVLRFRENRIELNTLIGEGKNGMAPL